MNLGSGAPDSLQPHTLPVFHLYIKYCHRNIVDQRKTLPNVNSSWVYFLLLFYYFTFQSRGCSTVSMSSKPNYKNRLPHRSPDSSSALCYVTHDFHVKTLISDYFLHLQCPNCLILIRVFQRIPTFWYYLLKCSSIIFDLKTKQKLERRCRRRDG